MFLPFLGKLIHERLNNLDLWHDSLVAKGNGLVDLFIDDKKTAVQNAIRYESEFRLGVKCLTGKVACAQNGSAAREIYV